MALAALLGATVVEHWWLRALKYDDAWIHLRYAANLAAGRGFVFNPGERVLGSAAILWTVGLAGLARVVGPAALPDATSVANGVGLAAVALTAAWAVRRLVPVWAALAVGGFLVSHGPLRSASVGGMETTLLALLEVAAFGALVRERWTAAGVLAGTACGVRVEAVFLAGAVVGAAWWRRGPVVRTALATAVVPLLVYGWAWAYFGHPLAQSTQAKRIVYSPPVGAAFGISTDALLEALPVVPGAEGILRWVALAGWTLLAAAGTRRLARRTPAGAWIAVAVGATVAFYAVLNPFMFVWYPCTFVPLGTVLALLGLVDLAARVPGLRRAPHAVALATAVLLAAGPLRAAWWPFVPPESARFRYAHPNGYANARVYRYAEIGRWLAARARPTDRVCLPEIGALGWYWPGRVLDAAALVSPEVLPYHPLPPGTRRTSTTGAVPPEAVRDFQPELVVGLEVFVEGLVRDPWFQAHYVPLARWAWFDGPAAWEGVPERLWGSAWVLAFRRRDVPWPDGAP